MKTEKKRTKTASFGVNGRRSHDSSAYYARRINEDVAGYNSKPAAYSEKPVPDQLVNRVLLDSCVSPDKSNRLPPPQCTPNGDVTPVCGGQGLR